MLLSLLDRKSLTALVLVGASVSMTGCGGTAAKPDWDREFVAGQGTNVFHSVGAVTLDAYGDLVTLGSSVELYVQPRQQYLWLTKFDRQGNVIWNNQFDLDGHIDVNDRALAADTSGNTYVVAHGALDLGNNVRESRDYLVKFDRWGQQSWKQPIGNGSAFNVLLAHGNIYTPGDAIRVHSPNGALQREILTGHNVWDVQVDGQGNIYGVSGTAVLKYDAQGNQQWRVNMPTSVSHASALAVNGQGDVYIVHHQYFEDNYRIQKFNLNGQSQWVRFVAEPRSSAGEMSSHPKIELDQQGNIVTVASNSAGRRVAKLAPNGNTLWSVDTTGGYVNSLTVDNANNVYIFGRSTGEKFDSSGRSQGKIGFSGTTTETSGSAIVNGSEIFVATALRSNATGYLAKFTNP